VGDNEDIQQELMTLATTLYGTDADLNFVTRMTGKEEHTEEMRALLRNECGLVQEPITGVWIQLLPGPAKLHDLNKGESDG
jgi:hypothetical protein